MRLRRKITVAFFGISSLVSIVLALFLYRFVETKLGDELSHRLRDITHVGAYAIDAASVSELRALHDGELDEARVHDVEHGDTYRKLYEQLRMIRRAEAGLIRYAYLLAPSKDPQKPRFIADADVLDLLANIAAGTAPADTEISHFGQAYDVTAVPLLGTALAECTPQLERDFVHDEAFKVNSISAYQPLAGADGKPLRAADGSCLAVLGVDIADTDMRTALDEAGSLAIKISIGVILLALIVSIAMGTVLTRSVLALSETVKRFAEKDFTARTAIKAKDEIGALGTSFNQMADTIQEHSENLETKVRERTSELLDEKATSERLLLNVLPRPIAERLKDGESEIVDRFDAVTVLFADIVGFTSLSSRTSPEKLVAMLNEVFSTFDRLAEKHGLEKIKTIGDAYMVVAGIPHPIADHAIAMTHMGLDMLAAIDEYSNKHGTNLTIRVGIHTGSVVAGVIGQKKFIYDLWGDTVNTASRMESSGIPGRIHLTEATASLLGEAFELESRGPIEVKGKGTMNTFLVLAAKERRV